MFFLFQLLNTNNTQFLTQKQDYTRQDMTKQDKEMRYNMKNKKRKTRKKVTNKEKKRVEPWAGSEKIEVLCLVQAQREKNSSLWPRLERKRRKDRPSKSKRKSGE